MRSSTGFGIIGLRGHRHLHPNSYTLTIPLDGAWPTLHPARPLAKIEDIKLIPATEVARKPPYCGGVASPLSVDSLLADPTMELVLTTDVPKVPFSSL